MSLDMTERDVLTGECELWKYRFDEASAALAAIYALVHIPTPKGTGSYTHFMRDFDEIRKLAKPFVGNGQFAK